MIRLFHLPYLWPLLLFSANKLTATPTPSSISSINKPFTFNESAWLSTEPPTHLTPREQPYYHNLGADWNAAPQQAQVILPIGQSAEILADFYHSILSMCTAMIASNIPAAPHGGAYIKGELALQFDSTEGGVSWAVVRAFVYWMLLNTQHGFTSTYTLWLTNYTTGHAIRFMLRAGQGGLMIGP